MAGPSHPFPLPRERWQQSAGGELGAVVAFGGGEGLPCGREIAGDGRVGEIRRPRSEIRTRSRQGVTWLHGYIVTGGRGEIRRSRSEVRRRKGIKTEAEEEGVGDGADGENRAGVFADEIEGFR